jgi:uncharacterized phiE125 gp8 family phage protein
MPANQDSFTEGEPAVEPVLATDVQTYGRIFETVDTALITLMAKAARKIVERMLNRATINRTIVAYWRTWPRQLLLPLAPISAITTVKYYDSAEALQTWAATEYDADLNIDPKSIQLSYGKSYPSVYSRPDAIQVTYVAGYGAAASDVPITLKMAIEAVALDLYEQRGLDGKPAETRPWKAQTQAVLNLLNAERRSIV